MKEQVINKKTILVGFYIFMSLSINSQTDTTRIRPTDPLAIKDNQVKNNLLDFLVSDTLYYDFRVHDIYKIRNGQIVMVSTNIDSFGVLVFVITAKEDRMNIRKIKRKDILSMKLTRYFETPLVATIKYIPIYDVMLGKKTMNILSTGACNYLFTTPNLKGLHYIDSNTVEKEKSTINEKKKDIDSVVCHFVQSITFDKDTIAAINYVDTSEIKKSLRQYSYSSGPSFYEKRLPPKKMPYLEWSNLDVDKHNFNSIFWGMLRKDYYLPKQKLDYPDFNLLCEDITTELLYYSKNIYTVRVKWKLPNMEKKYIAIISIQEKKGKYKVIGFNKRIYGLHY